MAGPKPQYIANLLAEKGTNLEPIRLETVVVDLLRQKMKQMSEDEIWEWTEDNLRFVANDLYQKETDCLIDAVKLNFDIWEEDDGHYIKFLDSPEIRLLRKLQKGTPKDFEIFCGDILSALGGTKNIVGGSYDGGIDFWSTDILLNGMTYPSTLGSRVVVVGQAKRYADGNHVSEVDLRAFVGASVRRLGELKRTKSEFIGLLQPAVLAFWITSDFHSNAKRFAQEMGIWYLNGIALCQLAISLGFDENYEANHA